MAAGNHLSGEGAMNKRIVEKCLAGQKALVTGGVLSSFYPVNDEKRLEP